MNKSFRISESEDNDLSYTLTPSTSRISSTESDTYFGDEDTISSGDDDEIDSLQYKLECLKGTYFEKKLQNTVLKRCIEVENVSKFMNDLASKDTSKDPMSEEQKRTIMKLYEKNKELCKKLKIISKQNKDITKEVFQLYLQVEKLMEERIELWDKCVKIHKLNIGDASAFLNFDESEQISDSQKDKEYILKGIDYVLFQKHRSVIQVSKILYNLITNSEVWWSKNENLLEILDCTSKVLDGDFDMKNKKIMEIVDEIIQRLNKVKI